MRGAAALHCTALHLKNSLPFLHYYLNLKLAAYSFYYYTIPYHTYSQWEKVLLLLPPLPTVEEGNIIHPMFHHL
jgi:hypothetical protein